MCRRDNIKMDGGYMDKLNKFLYILIDKHIIMPNYLHCIIIVGADLCVCPKNNIIKYKQGGHTGPPGCVKW